MLRGRKKGSVLLLSLMSLILIFVLAAVFINIAMVYETMDRVKSATEEGARIRAQATDMPLKEFAGIVESFHSPVGYDNADGDDYHMHDDVQERFYEDGAGGHVMPINPYGAVLGEAWREDAAYEMPELYMQSVFRADEATKDAVMFMITQTLGENTDGDPMVRVKKENICIDVKPLPSRDSEPTVPGKANNVVSFRCETASYGWVEDHVTLSYVEDNVVGDMEVRNAVYVAVVFEYKHLFYRALEGLGWSDPPVKKLYAVAYPQIDECVGAMC